MARFNKAKMFLNLALLLSLFLIINVAESKQLGIGFGKAESTLVCESVYGAQAGDTCSGVAQMFNLAANFFSQINPNLDCDNIFVGEWLCVDGSVI